MMTDKELLEALRIARDKAFVDPNDNKPDKELAHMLMDGVLIDFLRDINYNQAANYFETLKKTEFWYA